MRSLVVVFVVVCALSTLASAGDVDRIRTHLTGALAYVQARDVSRLSAAQQAKRAQAIRTLERYIARGLFPRRTDDTYSGLRPRFIDDRGVHCAVGQLIAESGHAPLAREIAASYEYAYVKDIDSPALLAWADEHGLTVDELARIQPKYGHIMRPPTVERLQRRIRSHVEGNQGDFILACTGEQPPPPRLTVRLVGDRAGNVKIKTDSEDRFARCFATKASELLREDSPWRWIPRRSFNTELTLDLPSPQQLLEKAVTDRIGYGDHCVPRPGAVPAHATIDIASREGKVDVRVATTPDNREVSACMREHFRSHLQAFGQHVQWHKEILLSPRVTSRRVEEALASLGRSAASECDRSLIRPRPPIRLAITARAHPDDEQIAVAVAGENKTFATCVERQLQAKLREWFSVPRNGKPYFRIDGHAEASLSFTVE